MLKAAQAPLPFYSVGLAHFLLRVAQRLTYRQYGFLALFASGRFAERWGQPRTDPDPSAIAELDQLGTESVLGIAQDDGSVAHFASVIEGGTFRRMPLSKLAPMEVGTRLYELMGLGSLPEALGLNAEFVKQFSEHGLNVRPEAK